MQTNTRRLARATDKREETEQSQNGARISHLALGFGLGTIPKVCVIKYGENLLLFLARTIGVLDHVQLQDHAHAEKRKNADRTIKNSHQTVIDNFDFKVTTQKH